MHPFAQGVDSEQI